MEIHEIISKDPDVLGGIPVFSGTRVPVSTLFDHLEAGVSLNEFLDDFPTVMREQAVSLLEVANRLVTEKVLEKLHETAA